MKGLNAVDDGVSKASRVSKRDGRWANIPEIKAKTYPPQQSMGSLLRELVKEARIEKKTGMLLYRPQRGAGGGGEGKGDGYRSPDPYDSPRGGKDTYTTRGQDDGGKTSDADRERQSKRDLVNKSHRRRHGKKSGRRDLARTVARGAMTQGIGSSVASQAATRSITSSILS